MDTKNKPEHYQYFFSLVALGVTIIVLSTIILLKQENFWLSLFEWIGWFFIIGAIRTWISFYKHRETQFFIRAIINTISGMFLILFPGIPAKMAFVLMALYITANGIVKFISYVLMKDGNVSKRLSFLVTAIFLIVIGLAILLGKIATTQLTMIFLGIYGLLLGFTYIADGIASIVPAKKKEAFKQHLRISPPIIITALMPRIMLDYINDKLTSETQPKVRSKLTKEKANVEILVHVTEKGFGAIGHCDISINNQVFSYGNYDVTSSRMLEAIGDGVLVMTNQDTYIPFCLKKSGKTIFSYGIYLNDKQIQQVQEELTKLMVPSYEWFPRSYYKKTDCKDYASNLFIASDKEARFYKFASGAFKTYFVLGANCVELVEAILGKSGMDVIHFNGIVSPGAYQNYLEKEFYRNDGLVLSRKIYRPDISVAKFAFRDIFK